MSARTGRPVSAVWSTPSTSPSRRSSCGPASSTPRRRPSSTAIKACAAPPWPSICAVSASRTSATSRAGSTPGRAPSTRRCAGTEEAVGEGAHEALDRPFGTQMFRSVRGLRPRNGILGAGSEGGRLPPPSVLAVVGAFVRIEERHGAAWITLDRAPLNLIVPELIAELRAAVEQLARDETVRAAVITGAGRAFTAGMQVQVLRDLTAVSAKALITSLQEAIHAVDAAGAPMGLPEVKVGAPSVIQAALLPALVGPGRAAEMLLTGESVSAEQAFEWGLVNRVTSDARLEAAAVELVEKILACSPTAIRIQKELMIRWRATDLGSAIRLSINAFAQNYTSTEAREAALAFLEKRKAVFPSRS